MQQGSHPALVHGRLWRGRTALWLVSPAFYTRCHPQLLLFTLTAGPRPAASSPLTVFGTVFFFVVGFVRVVFHPRVGDRAGDGVFLKGGRKSHTFQNASSASVGPIH